MRNKFLSFGFALALAALPWVASAESYSPQADQARLVQKIHKELVTLPFYSIFDHFTYQLNGNEVILEGEVTRPTLKSSAERVVERIEGVSKVDNRIKVLPLSNFDDQIRYREYYAIYGHPVLNRYALQAVGPIHIIVDNGHVTLEGVVANEMDKNVANIQANSVPGVFSVTNNLQVEHRAKS